MFDSEFASSAWDPFQAGHIQRLEGVQRCAARFVTGQYGRDVSVTGLMSDLNWRTLQERRFSSRMCMLYKTIHGLVACELPEYLSHAPRSGRAGHSLQLSIPHASIDAYRYSFSPRTIRIWNIFPAALVQAPSVNSFKEELTRHFLNGSLYVVSPRGHYNRPRLSGTNCMANIGPVY